MTLAVAVLKNIAGFLERAEMKGQEALAWCEAYSAVKMEIQAAETPTNPQGVLFPGFGSPPQPPVDNDHVASGHEQFRAPPSDLEI
jgi:hypothetical protein